jgi:tetratricopeptide (TPR) repeat protein
MRAIRSSVVCIAVVLASCAANPDRQTLAELHDVPADTQDVEVQGSLDMAMESYRRFLEETSVGRMTPEAMRRLADLQLEKEYGINVDTRIVELAAPELAAPERAGLPDVRDGQAPEQPAAASVAAAGESEEDFEQRATATAAPTLASANAPSRVALPGAEGAVMAGPLQAIEIYKQLLEQYPNYERADQVLYQMSRAYDELGQTEEAMGVMERFIGSYGHSKYLDEVQFRRGEYFFTRKKYRDAEAAYGAIIAAGAQSSYYELALYKLGWTLYKQEFYEEALQRYMALLDYKLSVGYDFDARHEEEDERRVADTFHVISLSFSNLGGPDVVPEYYATYGSRSYEDRIYRNLGEFYLEKLRYQDAAAVYGLFVQLHPLHRVSPHFSMRVIEIYEKGDFPKLVVDSKKAFAKSYGLQAEYWRHFDVNESPEVLSYLKRNLQDLANHYHALYQDETLEAEKPGNYREALTWYREYLASFPQDPESPSINYQVADLLLENHDFGDAATEYERTAYDYPVHERAAAAGYAAIYAHREHLKAASEAEHDVVRRATVTSSLRFADTFPEHEHAPVVLGAAAQDLYEMKDFELAAASGQKLVDRYPAGDLALRRSAWTVVAHSSFELERYPAAELAYSRVLELTPDGDDSRQALVDNLAASVYKQGELANTLGDYRSAADHFLRLQDVAPTSAVRPNAEYDAAAALMRLQDWGKAAEVLDDFRRTFPEHELNGEATKQLAFAYREGGQSALAAGEFERVAAESDDPELGREALLQAGELYERAADVDSALNVYVRYVKQHPQPVGVAIETRYKIAGMYEAKADAAAYAQELREIVAADAGAGAERTDRTKFLAARSGLVLAEQLYAQFVAVRLVQPFQQSLATKRERMDTTIDALESLIDYEVADVTAAATFYMAEVYWGFNRSLVESERPTGLDPAAAAEYEDAIEEEAFPFEEQAIEVHEKNRELIVAGVYNDWTKKSLERLALLVPGRYAKREIGSGFLPAIDIYAYRSPNAPNPNALAVESAPADSPVEAPTDENVMGTDEEAIEDGRIRQATAPGADNVTL